MAPSTEPADCFEIGLVMAGAISGGAYTAGVIDFLVQALDHWEERKAAKRAAVPRHDVKIRAMSGASAGAMTSAIAAVAFGNEVAPVTDIGSPPGPEENRLFDAWVRQIDISKLLGTADIDSHQKVVSLLDSTELETIAKLALEGQPRAKPRSYIDDPLAVFLTVANLRGVPYGFHLYGTRPNTLYGMSNHMDHVGFSVSASGKEIAGAFSLDPARAPGDNWPALANAALASGAFPVGLQPRLLERSHADYEGRFGRKPSWKPPTDPYRFLCVDGGLMDNEPLELARRYLSGGARKRNPRPGDYARRAVIMVDPFPNQIIFDEDWTGDDRLVSIVTTMFAALKNQARFKPEELALAEDSRIFSRFMISPSRQDGGGNPVEPAMASAILGGFGGFLAESFRRHDFQLGRRNCQNFLRRHFCLPATNVLHVATPAAIRERFYVKDPDGSRKLFRARDGSTQPLLPIIPLVGDISKEVPRPAPPDAGAVDIDRLERAISGRVKLVGRTLIDSDLRPVFGGLARWALRAAWNWKGAPPVTRKAVETIKRELARL